MSRDKNRDTRRQDASQIELKELLMLCGRNWKWFALSAAAALLVGWIVYVVSVPQYERTMKVIVKADDQSSNTVSKSLSQLSAYGVFSGTTVTANEMQALTSTDIMSEVVDRIDLDVTYSWRKALRRQDLYNEESPIKVTFLDLSAETEAKMTVGIDPEGKLTLRNFKKDKRSVGKGETIAARTGDTVSTPLGDVAIAAAGGRVEEPMTITVEKNDMLWTVKYFLKELDVKQTDKQSDIIRLAVTDKSRKRADDVLNTIILVYNDVWVANKNQVAASTSRFINSRLAVIEDELSGVDANISQYKSSNMLPDVKTAASIYMQESSSLNTRIMEVSNQLYMAKYIREYLADEANASNPIPSISGVNNASVERQIAEYNEQMLKRNNLAAHSSDKNSLVVSADRVLETLRGSILSSMDNNIHALSTQLQNLEKGEAKVNARIAANPTQARNLLSVERQQAVMESLYLYLLQKREENELSQTFTAYNTRIIEHPTGSLRPKSPRRGSLFGIFLIIGLAIPAVVLILNETIGDKVRRRSDIELGDATFLGEIPDSRKRRVVLRQAGNRQKVEIVMTHEASTATNEAFRLLRTNIEFLAKEKDIKVMQITSAEEGSGKSFIAANTAASLALAGKRVLLIDSDMRKASLSGLVNNPDRGLATLLENKGDSHDWIFQTELAGLDLLPAGTLPKNPTELLANGKLEQTIGELRDRYDYIVIDSPATKGKADAHIVAAMADCIVTVARCGHTGRTAMAESGMANLSKKNTAAVVLNGTKC